MAPGFRPGRKSRVWVNGLRLSRITDSFELKRSADTAEVSTNEDDDKTYMALLRSADFSANAIFDGSVDKTQEQLGAALGSSALQIWTETPEGDAIGSLAWMWRSVHSQVAVSAPAKGRVGVTVGSQPSFAVQVGAVLAQGTSPLTSTGAQTAFNSGISGGTARGGRFHVHVTARSTALTSFVIKLQHSSAGAVWADVLATTQNSTGAKSSTAAGTIKQRVRANISTFTIASGTKTINVLAAFARSS